MQRAMIADCEVSSSEPRIAANLSTVDEAVQAESLGVDIIEIRCDLIKPLDREAVVERAEGIRDAVGLPIIGTIRKFADGGKWYRYKSGAEERLEMFEGIMEFIDAIDIELNSQIKPQVIEFCREKGKTIILSHHNFAYTPGIENTTDDWESLTGLIEAMSEHDADLYKIACMACSKEDFFTMRRFLCGYVGDPTNSKPLTLIPMGDLGTLGRITFPMYGSCITYGSLGEALAPGQVPVKMLTEKLARARERFGKFPVRPERQLEAAELAVGTS